MCGINGFNFNDQAWIDAMNALTHHRGPDRTASCLKPGISFGHNRLATLDLSERGNQPMWDDRGEVMIIFNGEVYNWQELRRDLEKKYTFRSNSDTEVVLYAYKEYGVDCFAKLNGIFVIALWDCRSEQLIIARDHVGVNPLYYYHDGQRFIFSSEIKAILAHDIPRRVDMTAFNLYCKLLYVPLPHTMFQGISKLSPATYGIIHRGKLRLTRYWQVPTYQNTERSYAETVTEVHDLFKDSVRRQLVADRPVGIFLSGGLDSTAVLGAASEIGVSGIKTFSVGFKDSTDPQKFNADFDLARQTAKHYGANHHELMVGPQEILQCLKKVVWHLDEPNSNPTAGAMFLLSQLAKPDVAVVLGGDGGDELFGGYPRYLYSAWISAFQRWPGSLQRAVLAGLKLAGQQVAVNKLMTSPGSARISTFLSQKNNLIKSLVSPQAFQESADDNYLQQRFFSSDSALSPDFERMFMSVDRQSWMVDESLLRTNKMCLGWGVEPRVPVLDIRLVELAARIPTEWKFSRWQRPSHFQGKKIWRDAIQDWLPDHVKHERKRGWFTPMAKWMRGDLRPLVEATLAPGNLNEEFFDVAAVQRIWQGHLTSRVYNFNIIWAIVMWQLWYNEFMLEKSRFF